MIPKNSTPIKNEILINIFAKGLLNKDEMRIIFYIIRWSWGFDGKSRRQDYTKELTKRQIADDIGMDECQFNRIINKMVIEDKMIIKDGCYQFNEHWDKWKLDKSSSKTGQIIKRNLIKSQAKLDKSSSLIDPKPLQNKTLPDRKETLKETLKETQKENVVCVSPVETVETVDNSSKEKEKLLKKEMLDLVSGCFKESFLDGLFKKYPVDRIEKYFEELKYLENIRNPVGWLVTALKNDLDKGG